MDTIKMTFKESYSKEGRTVYCYTDGNEDFHTTTDWGKEITLKTTKNGKRYVDSTVPYMQWYRNRMEGKD